MATAVKVKMQCHSVNRQLTPQPGDPNAVSAVVSLVPQEAEGHVMTRGNFSLVFVDPAAGDNFEVGKVYTLTIS